MKHEASERWGRWLEGGVWERGETPSADYSQRISLQFGTVSRRLCSTYQGCLPIGPAFPRYDLKRLFPAIPSLEVRSYFLPSPLEYLPSL